ncbi:MAG: hypothetical protein HY553_20655, partial [Elusimicrobia bacterium]|nr:hypothetical protein [Elusimicrobiota bacterium]
AAAARGDASVAAFFDGADPGLSLDGLEYRRGRLRDGGVRAARLGQGGFGVVDEHPRVTGAVVKTAAIAFENALFADPAQLQSMLAAEEPTARRLADAGVGPRFFGTGTVGGNQVSVREQVYGRSLDRVISDRAFGPEEEKLVLAMLDRMAAAGIKVDDMHPRNIMLGATVLDPVRRAYLIDGGRVLDVPAGTPAPELRAQLEVQPIMTKARFMPGDGVYFEVFKTFRELLDEGLTRNRRTGRWERFVDALKEAFANADYGGLR